MVREDKEKLCIDLTDEEIKILTKERFRTIVRRKVLNLAIKEMNEVMDKHSKSQYLQSSSFKTANYLLQAGISTIVSIKEQHP